MFVDAGIAAVAVAGAPVAFDAQLQRRQPGLVAETIGGNLIDGDAGLEICSGSLAAWQPVSQAPLARAWSPGPSPLGRALSQAKPLNTSTSFLKSANGSKVGVSS